MASIATFKLRNVTNQIYYKETSKYWNEQYSISTQPVKFMGHLSLPYVVV